MVNTVVQRKINHILLFAAVHFPYEYAVGMLAVREGRSCKFPVFALVQDIDVHSLDSGVGHVAHSEVIGEGPFCPDAFCVCGEADGYSGPVASKFPEFLSHDALEPVRYAVEIAAVRIRLFRLADHHRISLCYKLFHIVILKL